MRGRNGVGGSLGDERKSRFSGGIVPSGVFGSDSQHRTLSALPQAPGDSGLGWGSLSTLNPPAYSSLG